MASINDFVTFPKLGIFPFQEEQQRLDGGWEVFVSSMGS